MDALGVLSCLDQAVTHLRALEGVPFVVSSAMELATSIIYQVNQFARVTLDIIQNPLGGRYFISLRYLYGRVVTLDRTRYPRPFLTVDLQFLVALRRSGVGKQVEGWWFRRRGLEREWE